MKNPLELLVSVPDTIWTRPVLTETERTLTILSPCPKAAPTPAVILDLSNQARTVLLSATQIDQ